MDQLQSVPDNGRKVPYVYCCRLAAVLMSGLMLLGGAADAQQSGKVARQEASSYPPLPILAPTAFTADAGDAKTYLRWNLQLEDERIVGWKIVELEPQKRTLTTETLTEPQYIAQGLTNGTNYVFAVVGVLADGSLTPASNTAAVTPRQVGEAQFAPRDRKGRKSSISVGSFKDIELGEYSAKVIFPDGQELIYDNCRPVDWKTRDGEHLIYPRHFGNGLDIGRFEESGLPRIVPTASKPAKVQLDPADTGFFPAQPPAGEYRDVQWGTPHPYLTDPITLPITATATGRFKEGERPRWKDPVIDGERVTFHYWQPLEVMGYRGKTYVMVWESWWPIERDRHGCSYHGLARQIEVRMPSVLRDGYQVMLNNGFGPGGSRQGVKSYNSGFRGPSNEIIDFSSGKNVQVCFQVAKPPRRGYQYHPDQDCLQATPLIFYDWGKGSLTIAARSLYYHGAQDSCSYVEQGADGVWPNLAWDLTVAGKRTLVDTVEYLYAPDTTQPLPQRYLNARFETYHNVSHRMGVQEDLAAVSSLGSVGQVPRGGGPVAFAEKKIAELKEKKDTGVDGIWIAHDFWQAVPHVVDEAYRLDENYDCNPQLRQMCRTFNAGGLHAGFWYRPEFTKTTIANVLSDTIPTADGSYYSIGLCKYPDAVALLEKRGILLVREHPQWIRLRKDGTWPHHTHYDWVPMSLATEWWERVMWPTLVTSRKLGFDFVMQDGGFGGLSGVDYSPRLAGKTDSAVPCQPYWWRMYRSMKAIDTHVFGECTRGWVGGNVNLTGPSDEYFLWMYHLGVIFVGNKGSVHTPERMHQIYQLYNGVSTRPGCEAVRRYARKFYSQNRAPDWVELKDLRPLEPREITIDSGKSPAAGEPRRSSDQNTQTRTVEPWVWTDVIWHYADGTSVAYPAYDKINWDGQ